MKLQAAFAVTLRHFYLMRGSPARVLPLFAWVGVDLILWGFFTRYLNNITGSGINFVALLLGGILLWGFFTRVMQGVAGAFFEDVWSRNFLNLFGSPMTVSEYLTGLVLSSIATSAVGLLAMLALAAALFGFSILIYGLPLVLFILVLFLSGIALGIVGCAIVLRYGPASEWFVWPIPALLSPFAGVFYPITTLPHWMQILSRLMPPSYVFEGMRAVVTGHGAPWETLAFGAALAAGYIVLACVCFMRVYKRAVRTGLIARYSAESVG